MLNRLMSKKNKVVVTGFGPFGEHDRNPSVDVAKDLEDHPPANCEVISKEMKVSYTEVSDTVPKLWEEHQPDLVVHIGVHSVKRCVKLESQAFPDGYCRDDVDGCVPPNNKCDPNLEQTLKCAIDVDALVERTKENVDKILPKEFSIEKSCDPGRYLCGFSYYLSLCKDDTKCIFIHIPILEDDVTIQLLSKIVSTVIEQIFENF